MDQPEQINTLLKTVILANGKFPEHPVPLALLKDADVLVCCDGSVGKLLEFGLKPTAIVGDLDSLSDELMAKFADRVFHNPDQNINDLTKAIEWCLSNNYKRVKILGATGLREDHTLGNIGLLSSYATKGAKAVMVTDYGTFTPLLKSTKLKSYIGQSVSIFSQSYSTKITTKNLEYPIVEGKLTELWMGTLNKSLGDWFEVNFTNGSVIVFRAH